MDTDRKQPGSSDRTGGRDQPGNEEQVSYWTGPRGQAWASRPEIMDAELDALGRMGIEALELAPGQAVLDVGCGCAGTTMQLAAAVGPAGRVVGVDISTPQLEVGRRRLAERGVANAELVEADAQTAELAPGAFDAVFSRFGVMFFADPPAAFANLRRAARPGGRLAFVCWRSPMENPWFTAPAVALAGLPGIEPAPVPDPLAPGPFALSDPERVVIVVAEAGWRGVTVQPKDHELVVPETSLDERVRFSLSQGPVAAALAAASPALRAEAEGRVRDALLAFSGPGGIHLTRSVWLVTARA